jgi:hypothetical protein
MTIPPLLGQRFRLDFVRPRPRATLLSWLLLAIGTVGFTMALADLAPRWIQRERLHQQKTQLRMRLDRIPGVARTPMHPTDAIGLAQARGVLEQLDRPWPALFDQFEATRGTGVHLVQLGVDARFQTALVLAEASSLDEVLRYSRELPGKGPVRAVRLTNHEWRNAAAGRIVVANLTIDLAPIGEVVR